MSECSCLGWDDGDQPAFWNEKVTTSRVARPCVGCGELVQVGQRKTTISGLWEDDLLTFIYHANCVALLRAAARNMGNCVWILGCDFNDCIEGWYNHAIDHDLMPLKEAVETVVNQEAV